MKDTEESTGQRSSLVRTLKIALVMLCVIALTVVVWVRYNVYASKFTPVSLHPEEQRLLESKLMLLEESGTSPSRYPGETALTPEPYSEKGARREISLSERELNGLIANTPDVARMVAIDLADDLISVKLVVPVDSEVPVLGGKTLRFHMGLTIIYEGDRPVIALKGVSLGGIPLPNAWLGYMKDKNLLEEFGTDEGFWKIFSEGVRDIRVRHGELRVTLKE